VDREVAITLYTPQTVLRRSVRSLARASRKGVLCAPLFIIEKANDFVVKLTMSNAQESIRTFHPSTQRICTRGQPVLAYVPFFGKRYLALRTLNMEFGAGNARCVTDLILTRRASGGE
jgi:hypothetical protein